MMLMIPLSRVKVRGEAPLRWVDPESIENLLDMFEQ